MGFEWSFRLIPARTGAWFLDFLNAAFRIGGNALLWQKSKVGDPIKIRTEYLNTPKDDVNRCYTIAEFKDFCVIVTHYATNDNNDYQTTMTNAILNEDIVKNYRKPVYIAGDMNFEPYDTIIPKFYNANFELLNDTTKVNRAYIYATTGSGRMIDLILEYNTNPRHKTLDRGIPSNATLNVSDHYPYYVKVKFK